MGHSSEIDDLPIIHWPVAQAYRRLYPDRVSILEPVFPESSPQPQERLVLYSGGKVDCLNARSGSPVWPAPVGCRSQPLLLGEPSGLSVFATPHRVFGVNRTTGHQVWSVGDDPPEEPSDDPEAVEAWTRHFLLEDTLFCLTNRGRLSCILASDGRPVWRAQTRSRGESCLAASRDRVFLTERRAGESVVLVLDARTGREEGDLWSGEGGPIERLIPMTERALLVVKSDALVSLDTASGSEIFHLAPSWRPVVTTLQTVGGALFMSDEGGRIRRYNQTTGELRWQRPIPDSGQGNPLWLKAAGDVLYAVSPDRLFAFHAAEGRLRWQRDTPDILDAQPPMCTSDAIVTITPLRPRDPLASRPDDSTNKRVPVRYVVRAYDRDGRARPAVPGSADLVTEPLLSFGGMHLHDGCVALLDGNILIGYVERPAATQRDMGLR